MSARHSLYGSTAIDEDGILAYQPTFKKEMAEINGIVQPGVSKESLWYVLVFLISGSQIKLEGEDAQMFMDAHENEQTHKFRKILEGTPEVEVVMSDANAPVPGGSNIS